MNFSEIWNAIATFFTETFHWSNLILFALGFVLMFIVLKVLYGNGAKKLAFSYIAVIAAMGLYIGFAQTTFAFILAIVVFLFYSMFALLLFSVEIKRGLWKAGARTSVTSAERNAPQSKLGIYAEECISNIVKAVQNLSKSDTGALIVLSNGNLPKEILESGVMLNSTISSQLIEGIFIPKAPLHDGAMIIYGDKIQAAGCFLPLTQKEYPKELGTRHRAGIGMTEVADVATIIVSEETGIVSIVKRGVITRYVDSDSLRKFLREYYWKEFNSESKR